MAQRRLPSSMSADVLRDAVGREELHDPVLVGRVEHPTHRVLQLRHVTDGNRALGCRRDSLTPTSTDPWSGSTRRPPACATRHPATRPLVPPSGVALLRARSCSSRPSTCSAHARATSPRQSGGYTLTVEYPQVTRAGQPAPFHVTVDAAAGFGDTVQMRVLRRVLQRPRLPELVSQPGRPRRPCRPGSSTSSTRRRPGTTLEISLDARVSPGQFGETDDCQVSVLVEDEEVVSASFTSWRMP